MSAVPSAPAVVTPPRLSLVQKFAAKYNVEAEKLLTTLKHTAFKVKEGEVSNEQMMALLIVADQYGLNPFTKEIFAFPDKQNGIVPVVSVDGWNRIINEHPQYDGLEFRYSEARIEPGDKRCAGLKWSAFEWIECVLSRKDRAKPYVVREFFEEVYRPPFEGKGNNGSYTVNGPWQSHPKRMLRHKALIQGARLAFGFAGIYDEDEAHRIIERDVTPEGSHTIQVVQPTTKSAPSIAERLDELDREVEGEVETTSEQKAKAEKKAVAEADKPLGEGQLRILRAKLKNAAMNDADLVAKFGNLDTLMASQFEGIQAWIAERAAKNG